MNNLKRSLCIALALILVLSLAACETNNLTPIEETYEHTTKSGNYVWPAVVEGWAERDALKTITEDGTFFCFTSDSATADDFINAQRFLLHFLRDCGVEIGEMFYCGTDYGYSFSLSSDQTAYVALSDVRTWKQILVTLQTIWGDYIDYGYVYALSNTLAEELGWNTDSVPVVEKTTMDTFFAENPDVLNLLYPTFSVKLASGETVRNSKALSTHIFKKIRWHKALSKSIDEQLGDFYSLVSSYAQKLSVPFTRQTCGYAYYGENVKLRIMTTYAELFIDANYQDAMSTVFDDYFSDYLSIYQTVNRINDEITASVNRFGLQDQAGVIKLKFLDEENSSTKKFTQGRDGMYYSSTHTAYVVSIDPYLHEYHHHIEYLLTQRTPYTWQSQAFCDIGRTNSYYPLYRIDKLFAEGQRADLFYACTGRAYQPGKADYFEVCDILCFINDDYWLNYNNASPINSISRYLIDRCGEEMTSQLMLYPETVEDVTGKTWAQWQAEWEQHIRKKYADVELPDWLFQ